MLSSGALCRICSLWRLTLNKPTRVWTSSPVFQLASFELWTANSKRQANLHNNSIASLRPTLNICMRSCIVFETTSTGVAVTIAIPVLRKHTFLFAWLKRILALSFTLNFWFRLKLLKFVFVCRKLLLLVLVASYQFELCSFSCRLTSECCIMTIKSRDGNCGH